MCIVLHSLTYTVCISNDVKSLWRDLTLRLCLPAQLLFSHLHIIIFQLHCNLFFNIFPSCWDLSFIRFYHSDRKYMLIISSLNSYIRVQPSFSWNDSFDDFHSVLCVIFKTPIRVSNSSGNWVNVLSSWKRCYSSHLFDISKKIHSSIPFLSVLCFFLCYTQLKHLWNYSSTKIHRKVRLVHSCWML